MKIKLYNLFCKECKPSQWVLIKAEKVIVILDLHKDEYNFDADCPKCHKAILNKRRVF